MNEAVKGSGLPLEAVDEGSDQGRIAALVQEEHRMGNEVRGLKKSGLLGTREVGYVSEVA